jgi:Tfp pilus assembly protein FimT
MSNVKGQMLNVKSKSLGFTLIEILIVIGILIVIIMFGLFLSFDFYRNYSFRSERNIIISVLQRARSQSMNNINQVRHGVHFQASPTLQYIMYECPGNILPCTYAASSADIVVNSSYSINVTSPSLPFDVVFDQLNGRCIGANCTTAPLAMTISDGVRFYNIAINSEGRIDW